jgi:hypothetical protein
VRKAGGVTRAKGSIAKPCLVCGTLGRRRYCSNHDPKRQARKAAHDFRKANYGKSS